MENTPQKASLALTIAVLIMGSLAVGRPALAQHGTPVAITADLDFRTRYLFAGIPFSGGEVVHGAINVEYGGWTFHAFTNYDIDLGEVNEGDVWGDYYHQFNTQLGGFVGATLNNFRIAGKWEPTPEIYGGLVLSVPGTPTLYFARDLDLTTGDHTSFTLSHAIAAGSVSVLAMGRIEYNNGYYRDGSSFSYADLNVSVPVALGQLTVAPMVILVGALAGDFEDRVLTGVNAHITIQ